MSIAEQTTASPKAATTEINYSPNKESTRQDSNELYSIRGWQIAFWLALAMITFLSVAPLDSEQIPMPNDKISHFLAYGFLLTLAHQGYFRFRLFVLILGLAGYGVAMEFVQSALPFRFLSVLDMVANCSGLLVYWLAHPILKYIPFMARPLNPNTEK